MKDLEKYIYKSALQIMPDAIEKIKTLKSEGKYIVIPFICDGIIDWLFYDVELKKFTKIKYSKGTGGGITFEPFMNDYSAYFDKVEYCEFDIPIKEL